MLKDEVDEIIDSLKPSEAIYRVSIQWNNNGFFFRKTHEITTQYVSFLAPAVLQYAREKLERDGKHYITVNRDKAISGSLTTCITTCAEFLRLHLPNAAPTQSKVYKFFDKLNTYKLEHTKFQDTMYALANYIHENKFDGKQDPKALATIEVIKGIKNKLMNELGIEEPQPKKRRH